MKKTILTLVAALALTFSGAALFASTSPVYAGAREQVCSGLGGCNTNPNDISNTVKNIVNIFSLIIGIVTVIVVIVAGLRFVTSGGDSGKVAGAKSTLIYAIVGLLIVLMSQSLVRFVLNRAG